MALLPVKKFSLKRDCQMDSIKLIGGDQPELRLARVQTEIEISMSEISQLPSLASAIAMCIRVSGLQHKDVYLELGIDAGHWTRIMQGTAHFPIDKLNALMDMCKNEIPLIWLASSRGYDLLKRSTMQLISEMLERSGGKIKARLTTYI